MTPQRIAGALVSSGLAPSERDGMTTLFERVFDALDGAPTHAWWVPGRLEVFGKHTDYAGGRSLVCAVPRGFAFGARPRSDDVVTATDAASGASVIIRRGDPLPDGWRRYVATVVRRLTSNFGGAPLGADIAFASDLPRASGMSSSSALVVGTAEALTSVARLRRVAGWRSNIADTLDAAGFYACIENGASFGTLIGDSGVGTHGGSEDHAAIMTGVPGQLSAFGFVPLRLLAQVAMPDEWRFVIAPSDTRAEKTGSAQAHYNHLSDAIARLLALWNAHRGPARSLGAALACTANAVQELHGLIDARHDAAGAAELHRRLDHFVREDARVPLAIRAFATADAAAIGALAAASHADADALLHNQVPSTLELVESATRLGAFAASSFGAGFGGSVWALAMRSEAPSLAERWHPAAFVARPAPPLTAFTVSSHGGAADAA